MIGKACLFLTPYYDVKEKRNKFKKRPILVVGMADSSDFTVLPISRVTATSHIDSEYDIKLEPSDYPELNLTDISYVRTHKQTVLNRGSFNKVIADFKDIYPDKYLEILVKLEQFNKNLIDNAI